MMINDIISATKHGKLHIECAEITLRQRTSKNPIFFTGTGHIHQAEDGALEFNLRVSEFKNTNMFGCLQSTLASKPGTLFAENEYYDLSASTTDGIEWTAERILVVSNWPGGDGKPTVTGRLWRLAANQLTIDIGYWLRIHFFDDIEVPTIVGTHNFSALDCDFIVRQLDHEFVIEAHSARSLGDNFYLRIQEALMFLLAQSVTWRALVTHDGQRQRLELTSAVPRSLKTRIDPPIGLSNYGHLTELWRLFSIYLDYVVKSTPHPYWNRCSYHLLNAREASANSVDAWAIGLGVAVEGIASHIRIEKTEEERKLLGKLIDSVLEHVESQSDLQGFVKRMRGLLSMMKEDRLQDRLKPLVESGHVDKAHIKAWSELRHKHVHPKLGDVKDMTSGDYQQLFDLMCKTMVLMYHIVFFLIGYNGKFTDYATHGYPLRDYPLAYPKEPG